MTFQRGTQYGLDTEPDNWLLRAACRGHDPEWWTVAPQSSTYGRDRNDSAVRICLSCPVRLRCLELGMQTRSAGVIFGGQRLLEAAVQTRECDHCGVEYMPVISFQRFCGPRCGDAARLRHYRKRRARARVR